MNVRLWVFLNRSIIIVIITTIDFQFQLIYFIILKKRDDAFELPRGYVLENKDLYDSVVFHVKEQICRF